jgi:hypothetical protein
MFTTNHNDVPMTNSLKVADPVLASTVKEIVTIARDGKNRKVTMLPIEFLSGWLFT